MVSQQVESKQLREHPFNLKGVGLWFFGGNKFLSENLIEKKSSFSEMGRTKYCVSTLYLKNIVFVEKIMLRQLVAIFFSSAALRSEKIYFDSEKKPQPPALPPLS